MASRHLTTDWRMPGMDGVEATRRIQASYPSAVIIAFASTDSPDVRAAFLAAGARAFVDKRHVKELVAAVPAVAEGADPNRAPGAGHGSDADANGR